ncbi:copper homeostasis membrane protein CopD [Caulobacter sp. 17J65-9]|uniref:copper homeostasis membrane protein CopD n=1 Tax=Caulobacter sp. 17J65-9 TaxID=2709382 RepID=UPI0013C8F761|nr:copper homeostasis membrane protein CopD [Caulobacter sp. 17J65-9]NEX91249.1 copper homeostasis membrane protein CopD [Caulobacter sp. 17J65-9]
MEAGAALVGARMLHYTGALLVFGAALFPSYAFGPSASPSGFHKSLQQLCVAAALLAVVGAALTLLATAGNMAGDIGAALQPDVLLAVSTETEFGRVWLGRLALGVLLVGLAASGPQRAWLSIVSAVFLASIALTGHARVETGTAGLVHMAVDGLHLLAAGAWLGALVPLGWMTVRRPDDEGTAVAMRRFAGVGTLAVGTLVVTGVANAAFLVDQPGALLATNYGRLLALKVFIFLLMLGLAGLNRFVVVPQLGREAAAVRRLRAHVALEQLFGFAVIVIVALLGTMDPGA